MNISGWGIKAFAVVASVFTALAASTAQAKEKEESDPAKPSGGDMPKNGYEAVEAYTRKLAGILGLNSTDTKTLVNLFLIQSYSESKGNHKAANRTDRESFYSEKLYNARNNFKSLASAVGAFTPRDWYFPGSSGWFGLMPTTLLNVVKGRNARNIGLGPHSTTDPWASVVMYAAYLAALVRRSDWGRSSQDAYALKAGGAAGSLMDEPHKDRYKTAARHLDSAVKKLRIPSSFGTRHVPARRMLGGRDWLAIYKKGLQ